MKIECAQRGAHVRAPSPQYTRGGDIDIDTVIHSGGDDDTDIDSDGDIDVVIMKVRVMVMVMMTVTVIVMTILIVMLIVILMLAWFSANGIKICNPFPGCHPPLGHQHYFLGSN